LDAFSNASFYRGQNGTRNNLARAAERTGHLKARYVFQNGEPMARIGGFAGRLV
jgi:hypothetical protein